MRPLISLIALAVLLAGCGYKTPLTLPKPKPGAHSTAPKPLPGQDEKKPTGGPRHGVLRYFAGGGAGTLPRLRLGVRRARPPDLLRGEGEFEPCRVERA